MYAHTYTHTHIIYTHAYKYTKNTYVHMSHRVHGQIHDLGTCVDGTNGTLLGVGLCKIPTKFSSSRRWALLPCIHICHACIFMCVYMCIRECVYVYAHVYIYLYVHTHTHTHTHLYIWDVCLCTAFAVYANVYASLLTRNTFYERRCEICICLWTYTCMEAHMRL